MAGRIAYVAMALSVFCVKASAQQPDLTWVADRLMIEDLMTRYAVAHNITEPEMYHDVFTEDAQIVRPDGAVVLDGLEEILASVETDIIRFNPDYEPGKRTFGVMRHIITNVEIEIHGDTATGSCYLLNTGFNETTQKPEIIAMGRYEDEYVKRNGRWLISRRTLIADWGNDELARQIGVGPHTPPEYR